MRITRHDQSEPARATTARATDTKRIFLEEWRKLVEPRFEGHGPEHAWADLCRQQKETPGPIVGVVTDEAFRTFARAACLMWIQHMLANEHAERGREAGELLKQFRDEIGASAGGVKCANFDASTGAVRACSPAELAELRERAEINEMARAILATVEGAAGPRGHDGHGGRDGSH